MREKWRKKGQKNPTGSPRGAAGRVPAPAEHGAVCIKDPSPETHAGRLKRAQKRFGDITKTKKKGCLHTHPEKRGDEALAPRSERLAMAPPTRAAIPPSSRAAPELLHTKFSSSGSDSGYPRFPSCTRFWQQAKQSSRLPS